MTSNETTTQSVSEFTDVTWLGALGALVTTATLGVAVGPVGVLAGGALALCWYRFPTVYAFALGHVAMAALVPKTAPLAVFAPVEVGLFLVLVGPAALDESRSRTVATTAGCFLGLLTVAWVARSSTDALWLTASAILGTTALLAYGVHRYGLVRFGLVEVES